MNGLSHVLNIKCFTLDLIYKFQFLPNERLSKNNSNVHIHLSDALVTRRVVCSIRRWDSRPLVSRTLKRHSISPVVKVYASARLNLELSLLSPSSYFAFPSHILLYQRLQSFLLCSQMSVCTEFALQGKMA